MEVFTEVFTLDAFRATGLPLDWMSLYVGWEEAAISYFGGLPLSDAAVQSVALDALSVCSANDENALFRIADDTSVHGDDIKRYLSEFAAKSGVSEAIARRKWRFVHLTALRDGVIQWDWDTEYYIDQWDVLPKPPPLFGETRTETLENFDALSDWLAQEKAELMQIPAANPNDLQTSVPPLQ